MLSLLPATAVTAGGLWECFGDVTLDYRVDVDDLVQVILHWGPCEGAPPSCTSCGDGIGVPPQPSAPAFCAADIAPLGDPDGQVDVDDLILIITQWGQCAVPPPQTGAGTVLWCEDWSLFNNYSRWTGTFYDDNNPCTQAGFNDVLFNTAAYSHRSQITCAGGINGVHRGYAALRFQGDDILHSFGAPSSGGIIAPHGIIVQFRNYLSVPYIFNSWKQGTWMSMMTATDDCSNAWARVITLNLDDPTMRLRPTHVSGIQYTLGAPAFPRDQWNRVTVYLNLFSGQMHVWQNGVKVCHAWFTRPTTQTCQYHFGLYASGVNNDITYYEDDLRIIRLNEPLLNLVGEPTFPDIAMPCMTVVP
jgi:hypothetical protein